MSDLNITPYPAGLNISSYSTNAETADAIVALKNINFGNTQFIDIYFGNTQIQQVYIGNTFVWNLNP